VLADDPIALIIDLSKVDFLATVGLRILAATYEKITLAGGRFAVVADSPATRRPIQLTDLNHLFSLYLALDDAITSVRKSQGTTAQ
jgi:anti-anti-sigma factor